MQKLSSLAPLSSTEKHGKHGERLEEGGRSSLYATFPTRCNTAEGLKYLNANFWLPLGANEIAHMAAI
jgi:hypothetical protein